MTAQLTTNFRALQWELHWQFATQILSFITWRKLRSLSFHRARTTSDTLMIFFSSQLLVRPTNFYSYFSQNNQALNSTASHMEKQEYFWTYIWKFNRIKQSKANCSKSPATNIYICLLPQHIKNRSSATSLKMNCAAIDCAAATQRIIINWHGNSFNV